MTRKLFPLLAAVMGTALVGVAAAQQPPDSLNTAPPGPPTINQSLEMRSAGSPRISPDGHWVAYEITRTNWESNAFERELWLADATSAQRIRLTSSKGSSYDAHWSPDGKWIAFLSDRPPLLAGAKESKAQIYLISAAGGEARELTKVETGVNSFSWAPDGHSIAFTATDAQTKARKDRDEKYGEIQIISGDYSMTHLWTMSVATDATDVNTPKQLTEGNSYTVGAYAWSPDSTRIAFSAQRDPELSSGETADIYVVTLADRAVKKIVSTPGPDSDPVWSPDGTEIAYQTADGSEYSFYTNHKIAVVPSVGGTPRVLTAKFDEDAAPIGWSADGIYFAALQKTYSHLFRVNPKTNAIERVSAPDALITAQFSFTRNFQQAAFVSATDNTWPEIYISSLRPFAPRALTAMGDQLKGLHTARRERIEWTSPDGNAKIEGILIKPADWDPNKKYPLLVVIHGGPTGVDRTSLAADRYYPMEIFAAKGALILRPNYRGSAGYGEAFRSLNVRDLGTGDYADVISGVDYLINKGWVDRDKVGAMGWSEGGYISAFITTSSDRFRAVSVGAGISDWMTYYVNTDIHPFTRQYMHATPWDDPEIYRKASPITYVKKGATKTPTLIQHGGSDRRVPLPNGFELYQALQDVGAPVRMVVYPTFGHPINKPKQQRSVMEENLHWFAHWIWGEPLTEEIH